MKSLCFGSLTVAILASGVFGASAQTNIAPLSLWIFGGGSISPFTNGQPLEVGHTYSMTAVPDVGFVFSSWQPADFFNFTVITRNPDGSTNPPQISVVPSAQNTNIYGSTLSFTVEPVTVITDTPNLTVTQSKGWRANFEPVILSGPVLSIQVINAAAILTWTNLSYNLQAAPTLLGSFTNVPNASNPYTNDISGPAQYFRLISN